MSKTSDEVLRKAKPGEIIKRGATLFVVNEVVDGHVWGCLTSLVEGECCRVCGLMRRRDKQNRPCKGSPELSLRGAK